MSKTNEHFMNVKNVYDDFYKFLLVKHGMFPVKDTEIGYWGVSVSEEVHEIFNRIELEKFNHIIDLGSGDGKVVMIASLFTKATGIEFDPWLHNTSLDIKNKLVHTPHVNRANFINGDFMEHNLSQYDVIFMNPDKNDGKLTEKIKNEFNGKLIVYGPHHNPDGMEIENKFDVNGTYVSIYNFSKNE